MEHLYRAHPSPTGEMRAGQLVPLPEAVEADTVVWFALPPEDDQTVWEGLAALSCGADEAILRSIPLFARGLGFGDRVSVVASGEGPLVATGVVEKSDQFSFRVWLGDGTATVSDIVREYGALGCYIEGYSEKLIGLSARFAAAQEVADALATGERTGRFVYETGR